LVKGQLSDLQSEMNQLHNEYPDLRDFSHELLWEQLTAIEADIYAEFVRAGRLNSKLAPLLAENLTQVEEKPL
jgi:monovalent cation:H+ antiporter, CPA1 family